MPRAAFHGLAAVANDCDGEPPRFPIRPLPAGRDDLATLEALVPAVHRSSRRRRGRAVHRLGGAGGRRQRADGRHALRGGHRSPLYRHRPSARFHEQGARGARRRRLEIRRAGADQSGRGLRLGRADGRIERLAAPDRSGRPSGRRPLQKLPPRSSAGEHDRLRRIARRQHSSRCLLADDPQRSSTACSIRLRDGCSPVELVGRWSSTRRPCASPSFRPPTNSAIGTRPCTPSLSPTPSTRGCAARESAELARGVFDAAMSVYLDRFLNVPAVPHPRSQEIRLPTRRSAGASFPRCSISDTRCKRGRAARRELSVRRRRPEGVDVRTGELCSSARTAIFTRFRRSKPPFASTN